jgi:hypothetical protein
MTADGGMIYAYVRTAAPITDWREGNQWMMLFIDADNRKSTGWEGYDFAVNYAVIDDTTTTLCAYKDNVWQEIGCVEYRVSGCEMMIAIPRSLLGLTEDAFTLNFHWLDHVTDVYDLHAWFTTGDSAPERRNDYTLTLNVPYDPSEAVIRPGRREGAVSCMPATPFSAEEEAEMKAGLWATLYTLPSQYGKMPDFDHIAANGRTTTHVSEISAEPGKGMSDFAVSFEGYIRVPADGAYTFPLRTNGCARLYVDGRMTDEILNPPAREAGRPSHGLGALRLAAGYHAVRLEYAEIGGGEPFLAKDGAWEIYCK